MDTYMWYQAIEERMKEQYIELAQDRGEVLKLVRIKQFNLFDIFFFLI